MTGLERQNLAVEIEKKGAVPLIRRIQTRDATSDWLPCSAFSAFPIRSRSCEGRWAINDTLPWMPV